MADHAGKMTPVRSTPTNFWNPRFSPDGRTLALEVLDKQRDVWVYDLARDTMSRLTSGPNYGYPVWTPDGRRIAYASRGSSQGLFWLRADGSGEPQRLTESNLLQIPISFHPSGKFLAFQEPHPQTGPDIMILPIEGDEASGWKPGKATAFLASPSVENFARFSPDGRWIAYMSQQTSRPEIYVRPFPSKEGKWQISTDGGVYPMWSTKSRELFYRTEDQVIMVASYTVEGHSLRAAKPKVWARTQLAGQSGTYYFDLHPDGTRFVGIQNPSVVSDVHTDRVVFIFNFFDELRRLTGK